MSDPIIIRVRRASGGGYAASGGGKRAACAWSPMEAVRRCADKVTCEAPLHLEKLAPEPADREKGVLYRFEVTPSAS